MIDDDGGSGLLDVLGNRNRRRIIKLLREKPCYVTEISERLTLNPKAVVDHLQYMERAEFLSSRKDARRRKYYYLVRDISIDIKVADAPGMLLNNVPSYHDKFINSVVNLRSLLNTRNRYIETLEYLEGDIDAAIDDLVHASKDILAGETEINLITALCNSDLSIPEIHRITDVPVSHIECAMKRLEGMGIVTRHGQKYSVRETNGK
ncbi:ArsR/SmtB family transcription factor [Methanogenium organophilum]|uniref:ArsR family transcriptional regulator n=1 Tax=Methanogenium organophilum TaxID=2199 RepID=A0A9X9T7P0_METOG|nr:ArsR family transcriptional regulator [Methanogenium organophilum]WAI01598.1 ArsR family transcriptional regulator [Methanogenium organophilum]